ncbi:MAG: phage major capsid protein, partial [Parvibaculales bacterium]
MKTQSNASKHEKQTPLTLKAERPEVRKAFDSFLSSFEQFKTANDERLAQIEKRQSADVITSEKVERINDALDSQKDALDELIASGQRPHIGGEEQPAICSEHKSAFLEYTKSGNAHALAQLETRALSDSVGNQGGYSIPVEIEGKISEKLKESSFMRSIASVQKVNSASYKKLYAKDAPSAIWGGGNATRNETDTPEFQEMEFATHELYAQPAASATLIEDSAANVEEWLVNSLHKAFEAEEELAFISGSGTNQPKGLANYSSSSNGGVTDVKFLASGASNGFASTNPQDRLLNLIYDLPSGHRSHASFIMNRSTQAVIRKMKTSNGDYLWQPSIASGQNATLLGYPVYESDHMPALASANLAVFFGNIEAAYLIIERRGIQLIRDPYSKKPWILFYTTKRIGG